MRSDLRFAHHYCVVHSCEALFDGVRRGPSSFTKLTYYSQLAYEFIPKDLRPRAVRFRLIPRDHAGDDDDDDSGHHGNSLPAADYLRQEFIGRLKQDEPVTYYLQIQINNSPEEPSVWNPQLVISL